MHERNGNNAVKGIVTGAASLAFVLGIDDTEGRTGLEVFALHQSHTGRIEPRRGGIVAENTGTGISATDTGRRLFHEHKTTGVRNLSAESQRRCCGKKNTFHNYPKKKAS